MANRISCRPWADDIQNNGLSWYYDGKLIGFTYRYPSQALSKCGDLKRWLMNNKSMFGRVVSKAPSKPL